MSLLDILGDLFRKPKSVTIKDMPEKSGDEVREILKKIHYGISGLGGFLHVLMGNVSIWYPEGSFGMVWGNRAKDNVAHVRNFFINEINEIMYVEPQTDEIFAPSTENVWIMIV